MRISSECADVLYAQAESERISLGQAAMAYVRRVHRELRAEATWESAEDDGFAPIEAPAPRSLGAGVSKRLVSLRITGPEAEALGQLKDEVRMSLPLIIDEAIRRSPELAVSSKPSA